MDPYRFVLIGRQARGKTLFISNLLGFSVEHGRSLCPVEWEITPSSKWRATVSVIRFTSSKTWPRDCVFKKELTSETIRSNCESPEELRLALSRAQVSVLFPELCYRLLHTASQEELRSEVLLSALCLRSCSGAIRICIQLPIRLHHPINIVDLPGVDRANCESLTKYYLLDNRRAILCFRVSDNRKEESRMASYVQVHKTLIAWKVYSCTSSVVATLDQVHDIDLSNDDPLNPSSFFFCADEHLLDDVFDPGYVLNLRKAESAFFQIEPPWQELRNQHTIGMNALMRVLANGRITSSAKISYFTAVVPFLLASLLLFFSLYDYNQPPF